MLLAWKNAQRLEASTFLLMDSVCAPLPSVSDSARNSAITAISSAIFLLEPEACSACSACSMLSLALMMASSMEWYGPVARLTEPHPARKRQARLDNGVSVAEGGWFKRGDARTGRLPIGARYRCRYRSVWSTMRR